MRGAFPLVIIAGLVPLLVLSTIALGLSLNLVLWQPSSLWTAQFPASHYDNGFTAIYADTTSVFAAGGSWDTRGGPPGNYYFLNKYYPDGRVAWTQRSMNQSIGLEIAGVQTDSSGEYIGGGINGAIIEKFDINGSTVWTRQYNDLSFTSIAIGTSGPYIGGQLGYPNYSGMIRSYDRNGNLIWTDITDNQTEGIDLVVHATWLYAEGNAVPNSYLRRYFPNGTLSWTRPGCLCEARSISDDSTGIYVAGGGTIFGLLSKFDFNGNILWKTTISSPDNSGAGAPFMFANSFGVYVTFNSGAGHTFVSRYDTNGNLIWSFQTQYVPSSIFGGPDGVYVGNRGLQAILSKFSESSSLIFFGINPPYSFVAVVLLGGGGAASFLLLWRHRKKRVHPPSADIMRYGPKTRTFGLTSHGATRVLIPRIAS